MSFFRSSKSKGHSNRKPFSKKRLFVQVSLMIFLASLANAESISSTSHSGRMAVLDSYSAEGRGDYQQAIDKMMPLFTTAPQDYFVNYRLGWLFYLKKNYKNAIGHYSNAEKTDLTSLEPLLGLTAVYLAVGNYSQLLSVSERLLARDPKNYYGMQRYVTAQIKLKNFPAALAKTQDALAVYPSDAIFLEQKAFAQMSLNSVKEAQETLSHLILISPRNEYARMILGHGQR